MIIKDVNLEPLSLMGTCRARVYDDGIAIKAYGIAGCLKAWLTSKNGTKEIGNLVNGSIQKEIDTSPYSGILITQSGRQMFYGKFRDEPDEEESAEESEAEETAAEETEAEIGETEEVLEEEANEGEDAADDPVCPQCAARDETEETPKILSFGDGYAWRAVTERTFPSDSNSIKYILSHRAFYNAFLQHGRYFYGENGHLAAIAVECDIKNEPHPFPNLTDFCAYRDGYMIVCADKEANNFCNYEY